MWRRTLQVVPKAAQPAVAADRFAREIVRFLKVIGSALAAAERHSVRRAINACACSILVLCSRRPTKGTLSTVT
jgi:hypothetical protein